MIHSEVMKVYRMFDFTRVQKQTYCRECGKVLEVNEYAFFDRVSEIFDGCVRCCGGGD